MVVADVAGRLGRRPETLLEVYEDVFRAVKAGVGPKTQSAVLYSRVFC